MYDEQPEVEEKTPKVDPWRQELLYFKRFAELLKQRRGSYGHDPQEDKFSLQKRQLEGLGELEEQFRLLLIQSPHGKEAYKAFIEHICSTKRNILAARPFFRERQQVFTSKISDVLKEKNWRGLFEFHINYQFVALAVKSLGPNASPELKKLARQISVLRCEIAETNLPLAIARAKMFWSKTPKSQLTFMDFVQIATEGLLSAIDKFVLPYSEVFRCVAIGRMLGNFIEAYSETVLHFYPTDKRKVYRANKYLSRNPHDVDYELLADSINKDCVTKDTKDCHRTTSSEIYNLVNAVSCVSANSKIPGQSLSGVENISQYAAPEDIRPDVQYESQQAMHALKKSMKKLTLLEKKVLRLSGIDIELAA
jgi:DNA-directed RNA polymerase specialized sigma subunit